MKYYYAGPDNKTAGPVTVEEIQAMAKSGTLKADPMVVPEGSSEWRPLSVYLANPPGSGAPPPPPSPHHAAIAADKAMAASKDAVAAFKMFATNPVGGLAAAYESLGTKRAFGVGIAFGSLSAIFLLIMAYRMTSSPYSSHNFDFFIKALLFSLVPFASLLGASAGTRLVFGGRGGFDQDCFIAGAAMLPIVIVAVLASVLGESGGHFVSICSVFAFCLTVLMLFSGLSRISKIGERAAAFAVPCVIVVAFALSFWLYKAMLNSMTGGGIPGFFN